MLAGSSVTRCVCVCVTQALMRARGFDGVTEEEAAAIIADIDSADNDGRLSAVRDLAAQRDGV